MLKLTVVIFSILFTACNEKPKASSSLNTRKQQKEEINRVWIDYNEENNESISKELYIYPSGDSILNQYKVYKNKVLNKLSSHYYEFSKIESKNGTNFKGSLQFYSIHDTIKKFKGKTLRFSFLQENKDSIYYKTYDFKFDSKIVEFEYNNIDNQSIYGFIREVITIDTIINKEKKVRIIENITLVDNKNPTINPYNIIEWVQEK